MTESAGTAASHLDPEQEARLLAAFPRGEEAYAAVTVSRALGVRVEPRDVPGAPRGTVDAEVIYPDGRTAAIEITSVEDRSHWHLRARIDKLKPKPAPGRLMWSMRPNTVEEIDRLLAIHERVIALCEAHGVRGPEYLPWELIEADADLRWLAWEGFQGRMSGHHVESNPRVWWMYPIESAVFDSEADEIAAGVAEALKVEPCVGHIEKLLRDPHEERHLFLVIGTTGLGNAAAFSLIDAEHVPTVDPDLPDGLDHLWLGPGYGSTVTVWSRGVGWRNVDAFGEPRRPRREREPEIKSSPLRAAPAWTLRVEDRSHEIAIEPGAAMPP